MNWLSRIHALWLAAIMVMATTASAVGQGTSDAPNITGFDLPTDPDYEQAIAYRRLQSDLVYIDQLEGDIPMDGLALRQPEPEEDRDTTDGDAALKASEVITRAALIMLAVFLAIALYKSRHNLAERLGRPPRKAVAKTPPPQQQDIVPEGGHAGLIERLRAMADKEEALVLLLEATLSSAARQNGLRLGRAETARDLLRRLPRRWEHLPGLRGLVMAEELVQFGGRPLAEPTFEECLRTAIPILGAQGARA